MNDLPVFMRPIVIDDDNDSISVSGTPYTLAHGTYPNIAAVCKEINTKTSLTVTFSSSFHVVLTSGTTFSVTWTDTALRDLLGFTGSLSSASTYTATYTPEMCWCPTRSRADEREWVLEAQAQWRGSQSRSGYVCGLRTGASVYSTKIEFNALGSHEVLGSRTRSAIEAVRCLEYFAAQSRENWSDEGDPPLGGFYFVPDLTTVTAAASASWTSGNPATFSYTVSPSTWVWCQFNSDWYPSPRQTLGIRSDYTDVDLDIHSATAPTWTGA